MNLWPMATPTFEGDVDDAVVHRDGRLQIIASAGSGKTKAVSQRVAHLIPTGNRPRGTFTFTLADSAGLPSERNGLR